MSNINLLNSLKKKLEKLGYKTREHENGIVIILPLQCSIVVDFEEDKVRCQPKFNKVRRSTATWMNLSVGMLIATVFIFFVNDELRLTVFLLWMFLMAGIWDLYRYILTEQMITRIWNFVKEE